MPIYYGNKEVKGIYYGSTEIKSVYYGGTKVYSSGIPVSRYGYSADGTALSFFVFGQLNTQSLICNVLGGDDTLLTGTIISITGTLGTSGSKISVANFSSIDYYAKKTYNGVTLYIYRVLSDGLYYYFYVFPDSTVGSYVCISYFAQPTINSITEQTIKVNVLTNTYTGTRDTTYHRYWTKDGLS